MANMNQANGAIKGRNPLSNQAMPAFGSNEVKEAAIWIESGKYVPMKSMPSLTEGGAADGELVNLKLESSLERLNGIVVTADVWEKRGAYEVKDGTIELSGYGCSDFTCRGAAAMVYGGGALELRNMDITTRGSTRCATLATENGTLRVYDSRLSTHGGELPPGYEPVIGPGMMEPPWPLGLEGNCRTHLSMDGSRSFFYNCDIFARAWAAFSTDSSGGCLYLEGNDCRINVPGNGYGIYADNGCYTAFNRCEFNVGNMLAILDGNASITLTDTNARCAKNGFVCHGGLPEYVDTSLLEIHGGEILAQESVILAKSTNLDVYVAGAKLQAAKGGILKSMCNDDPIYYERAAKGEGCYGVQATFEAMEIEGDILHEDTDRKMRVSLMDTKVKGKITGFPELNLYGDSHWIATGDSAVQLSQALDMECVDALPGVTITAKTSGGCVFEGGYSLKSGGKLSIV